MNHSTSWPSPSASAPARTTRISPSPPRPARRSHRADTVDAASSSRPSGSGRRTKSFSVPWPLTKRTAVPGVWVTGSAYGRGTSEIDDPGGQVGGVVRQPDHARVAPEPQLLAPRVPPGRRDGLLL